MIASFFLSFPQCPHFLRGCLHEPEKEIREGIQGRRFSNFNSFVSARLSIQMCVCLNGRKSHRGGFVSSYVGLLGRSVSSSFLPSLRNNNFCQSMCSLPSLCLSVCESFFCPSSLTKVSRSGMKATSSSPSPSL